jgi:hypothetical protein
LKNRVFLSLLQIKGLFPVWEVLNILFPLWCASLLFIRLFLQHHLGLCSIVTSSERWLLLRTHSAPSGSLIYLSWFSLASSHLSVPEVVTCFDTYDISINMMFHWGRKDFYTISTDSPVPIPVAGPKCNQWVPKTFNWTRKASWAFMV